ncbi:MAG: hypothetical protein CL846_09365 [Crocinitomicaceae bacterium]|nr:hypothetical protein [Crocinitomicaceae bacterium]|tara:strand:- start:11110 stop:12348 length:1239 start_codon:yes stop_codon:yes gene_type:complete
MFLKNIISKYNLTQILLLVTALLIPLEKTSMRIILGIITLVVLITGKYTAFSNKKSWIKLSLTLLWIIPFIQLIILIILNGSWENWEEPLIIKLSLLLFPIFIFLGFELKKDFIYELIRVFLIGCCISVSICLLYALYNFLDTNNTTHFFYRELSYFHHPSYFSMYLNFAIGILYLNIISPYYQFEKKWSWTLIIAFTLFIVLASSRTGWISNFLINSTFIIILIKKQFFTKKHLLIGFAIIALLVTIVNVSPSLKIRFDEMINNTVYANQQSNSTSSTSTRKKAWESSTVLIKQNWLFGLGTGLGKNELNKIYDLKGYDSLKEDNTNTHNQYLQYLLDHGIIGLSFLVFFTIIMLFISFNDKYYLYTLFLIIMIINFMTESILETQSGIVFFAFFNTLFFYNWIDKKHKVI